MTVGGNPSPARYDRPTQQPGPLRRCIVINALGINRQPRPAPVQFLAPSPRTHGRTEARETSLFRFLPDSSHRPSHSARRAFSPVLSYPCDDRTTACPKALGTSVATIPKDKILLAAQSLIYMTQQFTFRHRRGVGFSWQRRKQQRRKPQRRSRLRRPPRRRRSSRRP